MDPGKRVGRGRKDNRGVERNGAARLNVIDTNDGDSATKGEGLELERQLNDYRRAGGDGRRDTSRRGRQTRYETRTGGARDLVYTSLLAAGEDDEYYGRRNDLINVPRIHLNTLL